MSPRSFKRSFAASIVDGVVSSQRQSTLRQVVVMARVCVVMSVRRLVAWVRRMKASMQHCTPCAFKRCVLCWAERLAIGVSWSLTASGQFY